MAEVCREASVQVGRRRSNSWAPPAPPNPARAAARGLQRARSNDKSARRRTRILLVGPAAASRKNILEIVAPKGQGRAVTAEPSTEILATRNVGADIELVNCDLNFWSADGPVDAVICVVDSTSADDIKGARQQLSALLEQEKLATAPLLILADEQDRPQALPAWRVAEKLRLHDLTGRKWSVQGCCQARREEVVFEGVQWLMEAHTRERTAMAERGAEAPLPTRPSPPAWLTRLVAGRRKALEEHFGGIDAEENAELQIIISL